MSHHQEHDHEHAKRPGRHTWKFVLVVVAALGAILVYLASMDESLVPGGTRPATPTSSASGK